MASLSLHSFSFLRSGHTCSGKESNGFCSPSCKMRWSAGSVTETPLHRANIASSVRLRLGLSQPTPAGCTPLSAFVKSLIWIQTIFVGDSDAGAVQLQSRQHYRAGYGEELCPRSSTDQPGPHRSYVQEGNIRIWNEAPCVTLCRKNSKLSTLSYQSAQASRAA